MTMFKVRWKNKYVVVVVAVVVVAAAKDQAKLKSRKDAVFLAQFRSGHCLSFKAYCSEISMQL